MKIYYRLAIQTDSSKESYDSISRVLGTQPTLFETKLPPESKYNAWSYERISNEKDAYIDYINHFLDILEGKYVQLQSMGVNRSDIIVWMLYEYHQQCNLEFNPEQMKRLGNNGIGLCISCWEGGIEEE